MSGHLLWRDTFSMYGLFYHVNVPLMRGHLVNVDRIFWFSVPANAGSNHYFRNSFLKMFYFQNGDRQTARRVVGKTTLYREFGYKAVGRGPRFSAAGGNAKWACLNLLRIALTVLKKQVNNVNDNERLSTSCLFGVAADINR